MIFYQNEQERINHLRKTLNKYYPDFKSAGYYFRNYLKNNLDENKVVLDAGCGEKGLISEFKPHIKNIIGVDIDKESLKNNLIINQKILANLSSVPIEDQSIDIITAEFVLEHLKNPNEVFQEFSRILKSNGSLIFVTPNILNPIMIMSKILPLGFHKIFRKKLLKKENDSYYTHYSANTYQKLKKLGLMNNFKKIEIKRAGSPEYTGFCKPLMLPSVILEKMINSKPLNPLKIYLVGCFSKSSPPTP